MANIFSKKDQYIDRVNRSTFDLSFVNNFTTNFGVITPVCLLPVGFGDSVQINAKFNLQLMPTVFPIQTQMYARLHFVYVRTRTIWEDWQKFFGGDESVTPPWIDFSSASSSTTRMTVAEDLQTSALADYLGVPTVITGTYGATSIVDYNDSPTITVVNPNTDNLPESGYYASSIRTFESLKEFLQSSRTFTSTFSARSTSDLKTGYNAFAMPLSSVSFGSVDKISLSLDFSGFSTDALSVINEIGALALYTSLDSDDSTFLYSSEADVKGSIVTFEFNNMAPSEFSNGYAVLFMPWAEDSSVLTTCKWFEYVTISAGNTYALSSLATSVFSKVSFVTTDSTWTKPEAANCPFYTDSLDKLPAIPLSALPFRVYEAYYNAFGRDVRNNPFIIDGKAEYNRYVPSLASGPDLNKYQLHYANWEPDAYTTALQSPQAGVAPLVGISSLGEAQFRDASGTVYTAQLETADDGDTVTGFQMKSSDAPADVVRNLIGMATSGISISDFRNVNSLQRFLEIRIRQSPRYLNLVKGLFNVNLDYDELMMPEFLGGISDNVPVYKVTQTTPTDGSPLGSFAGQGFIQSGMKHVIRKYCPEEGYILGVLSVVPVANYTQLLMPHWTRMSLLDWHFPQFNNVSFQPMTYKNLCPYQAYAVNPANINNVFGYQRVWWDLISSFDEVHGQFRSSLRNFVINRVFDSAPELSQDFLLVNPDHVNDVFATTAENGDKILGSIAFDITKKTTIPRNSIPHIE
jgi:hypothetical protein